MLYREGFTYHCALLSCIQARTNSTNTSVASQNAACNVVIIIRLHDTFYCNEDLHYITVCCCLGALAALGFLKRSICRAFINGECSSFASRTEVAIHF